MHKARNPPRVVYDFFPSLLSHAGKSIERKKEGGAIFIPMNASRRKKYAVLVVQCSISENKSHSMCLLVLHREVGLG